MKRTLMAETNKDIRRARPEPSDPTDGPDIVIAADGGITT